MKCRSVLTLLALSLAVTGIAGTAPATRQLPKDYQVENFTPRGITESTRLDRLTASDTLNVAIGLPLRNRKALATLHQQLHDASHPLYHQWLTSDQFAQAFGPTAEDYNAVVAWARAKGLEIVQTSPNRLILNVKGPAPVIEAAFGVQMNNYQSPEGRVFHSPDRAPTLDLDVAIASINGLNNAVKPVSRIKHLPTPQATPHAGSGTGGLYIGKDFRAAYASGVPTTTTGSGQGIALFEFSEYYPVDVTNYFTTAGITLPSITVVTAGSSPDSYDGEDEVALDIDIAGSMAPGASIYVYEGADGTTILNQIVTDGKCKSVGVSWGWASDNMTTQTSIDSTQDAVFEAMDTAGIACFVAAGDSGTWTTSQWAQSVTSSSFNPINPADEPYVTSVGATELSTSSASGPWSGDVVWPDSGSGYSHRYAMPSYQTTGITWANVSGASTTMRNCNDVASVGYNVYLDYDDGAEKAQNVGGTSCAAPLWAAFAALANQTAIAAGKSAMGYINPLLYAVGTGSSYSTCFHDVTSGTDGITAGTGFDMPSGWGTPVGLTTINALIGSTTQTVSVAISPTTASIQTGATQQFTATVSGSTNTSVTWTCSGGTVSTSGLFTAPATAGTYTVTATSVASTTVSATATVTVTAAPAITVAISPTTASVVEGGTQQFTDTVTGTTNTAVTWTCTGGTITTAGLYTAPATTGTYTVTCTSQASTSVKATATVTVTATPVITVAVSPTTASLTEGGTEQFTDTVTGTTNTAVTWTCTGGTITTAGLYTAPATAGTYTVTCTSQASTSVKATATVTVTASTAQQLILNPDFASGSTDWTATSDVIGAWGTSEAAYSGTYCAWLDGYTSAHTDYLYQTVAIPSTISTATLNVWLHIDTSETNGTADDTLKIEVRNTSGTVLATLATFSNLNAATGYTEHSYSLAAYKGESVEIYFLAAQTGKKETSFVVGQVNLNVQ